MAKCELEILGEFFVYASSEAFAFLSLPSESIIKIHFQSSCQDRRYGISPLFPAPIVARCTNAFSIPIVRIVEADACPILSHFLFRTHTRLEFRAAHGHDKIRSGAVSCAYLFKFFETFLCGMFAMFELFYVTEYAIYAESTIYCLNSLFFLVA